MTLNSGPIRSAINLLHQQWQQPPSLQELAASVGMSPYYLHRSLTSLLGESVGQYCLRSRIAGAAYLLGDPTLTITDVAMMVGYDTPAAFSAAFRGRAGLTPQQWRKQLCQKRPWLSGLSAQPDLVWQLEQTIWGRQFRGEQAVIAAANMWRPQICIRYDLPPFTPLEQCRFDLGHEPDHLPMAGSHMVTLKGGREAYFHAQIPFVMEKEAVAQALFFCRSKGFVPALSPASVVLSYENGEIWIRAVRVPLIS